MNVDALDHLVLTVRDIHRTADFYSRVLGMEVITFGEGRVALRFGQQKINLHQFGQEFEPHACAPTPGSADLCFTTQTSLEQVIKHCHHLNVEIIAGPVERAGAIAPLKSIYFRDPDLNLVEVANRIGPETSTDNWQLPHRFLFDGQQVAYDVVGPILSLHLS
jgi:catechol 2,3-dioxygenase-like lactoylglutathione lyase family enzyme